ncbi:MAG: hypothetical protein ABI682_05175 [Acidobacteriota bacterium]
MKKILLTSLACLALTGPLLSQERDAKADAVGHEFQAALGGENAWAKARQFRFDFVVEREGKPIARFSHVWDRYTGDYRLTGTDKTGAPFSVFFNVNTKEGQAFVNGTPAEGEARDAQLKNAYGRFINDSYWLLAPWKIFDPGVRLAYDGEKPCPEGTVTGTCDVLKLSFENVGLTPKDVYWLWVTRDGRKMVAWQYLLNGAEEAPTMAMWKDWKNYGGILLATEKPMVGKPAVIRFENVSVTSTRDDSLFHPSQVPARR